jgi:hypothetical protein
MGHNSLLYASTYGVPLTMTPWDKAGLVDEMPVGIFAGMMVTSSQRLYACRWLPLTSSRDSISAFMSAFRSAQRDLSRPE